MRIVGKGNNMYWINSRALKNKLRSGDFSDRDAIPYIIAEGILINLVLLLSGTPEGKTSLVSTVAGVLAVVLGTWFVFKKHNPDSSSSFLKKYLSLGWVVSIQFFLIFISILLLVLVPAIIWGITSINGELVANAAEIIFYFLYYLLLGKYISET